MPKKVFFILFLLSFGPLDAQTSIDLLIAKGDSLVAVKKYEKAFSIYQEALVLTNDLKNDHRRAQLFKKIGVYYYRKKQYREAEKRYRKSLRIDSNSKTAADGYYNISLVKRKLNQVDSVLPYLERSMQLYKVLDQNGASYNAYLTAGIVYKNRQLFDVALEYLLKADEGFKTLNAVKKQASVANTIGNIHNRLKNYEEALRYFRRSIILREGVKEGKDSWVSYNNIGKTYSKLVMYDSAMTNYQRALSLLKLGDSDYGIVLRNMANVQRSLGHLKMSEKSFRSSIKANKYIRDTTSLLYSYNGITNFYLETDKLGEVKLYLDTISVLLEKGSDPLTKLVYFKNQSTYNHKIKEFASAFDYQKKYSNLFEEIYDMEKAEAVMDLQSRFEYEKKENENLQLSLANQNNRLLIEKQKNDLQRTNWILVLLALSLMTLGIGYYLFAQRQKVKNQHVRIEKLEAIYQGQETIKKRIARDLHDIITTNFDGLRLKMLTLPRAKNPQELSDEIAEDLTSINQQIRQVSHRLSPLEMHVKERPFTEIIKSRLSEFQLYRKIFVTLENELPAVLNTLSSESQNHVYSILLEALNNIEKHACATETEVSFYKDAEGFMHLRVTDNGIGISNSDTAGIGLMNIRQRAELLGGQSVIEKVTTGTKVHLTFPLKT